MFYFTEYHKGVLIIIIRRKTLKYIVVHSVQEHILNQLDIRLHFKAGYQYNTNTY